MRIQPLIYISSLFITLTLSSCGFFSKVFHGDSKTKVSPEVEELRSYMPIENPDVHVNMSIGDFNATHDSNDYRISRSTKATYYIKDINEHPIKTVYYMFNTDNKLYEIIYEYYPDVDVDAIMKEKYKEKNNDQEWRFNTKSGTVLKIWKYGQKICIADAAMFPFG